MRDLTITLIAQMQSAPGQSLCRIGIHLQKKELDEQIKNIYKTDELGEVSTIRKFRIVRQEEKREVARNIDHYNLDMIISMGYRVNSKTATKFRKWATQTLKQYITLLIAESDPASKARMIGLVILLLTGRENHA